MGLTSITNIPKIMRAKKWDDGAQLMDKWFAGPSTTKPAYTTPDTTTIKMDAWALKFSRCKAVYDDMVNNKVWSSDKARPLYPSRLKSAGMSVLGWCMDLSSKSVVAQHPLHVNFRTVTQGVFDPLDDMAAALANFGIYVVPLVADVTPEGGQYRVKLYTVGFHIMDSYDFEGSQDLGYWDEDSNDASASWMWSGTQVTNDTFRNWRNTNGKGGDFLVYSDVKKLELKPPESFLV